MSAYLLSNLNKLHNEVTDKDPTNHRVDNRSASSLSWLSSAPFTLLAHSLKSLTLLNKQRDDMTRDAIALHELKLAQSSDRHQWSETASRLDVLHGNDIWKARDDSSDYDHALIRRSLRRMDAARLSGSVTDMLLEIRTRLTRNLGGMGNNRLYTHTYTGTKHLIDRYIESTLETLHTLLQQTEPLRDTTLTQRHLLDQLLLARQSFGRSALLLSGGGTFGLNHIGVVKTLWEARLLPQIVSGSSAGSIVVGPLCCKTDEELPAVIDQLCSGDLSVFTRPGEDTILTSASRFLKHGYLYDVNNLVRIMRNIVGDLTFLDAFNRSRRILNICVSNVGRYELPRLLNYVVSPDVVVWYVEVLLPVYSASSLPAIRVSCQIPWMLGSCDMCCLLFRTLCADS